MTKKSTPEPPSAKAIRDALFRAYGREFHDPIPAAILEAEPAPDFADLPAFRTLAEFAAEIDRLKAVEDAAAALLAGLGKLDAATRAEFDAAARASRRDNGAPEPLTEVLSAFGVCEPTVAAGAMVGFLAGERRADLERQAAALAEFRAPTGLAPSDLRGEVIADCLAEIHIGETGKLPRPSFGGDGASNKFSALVAEVFMACGVAVHPKRAVERACARAAKRHPNLAD